MRLDNDATHLADAQSRRKETAKKGKGIFRDALLHPPDARPRTLAKGFVPGPPDPVPSALPVYSNMYIARSLMAFSVTSQS
jgi:hypothetical protein